MEQAAILKPQGDFSPNNCNEEKSISANSLDPMALSIIKNPLLKDIHKNTIKKAWFAMAHLMLENGSRVLDVRCQHGMGTYAMAALNPNIEFIGIDKDHRKIKEAEKNYKLPNLQFIGGDIQENFLPKQSIDGVVNAFTLHEIYSESNCSEKAVIQTLEKQFELLKQGGYIFIQGHVMPQQEDYVLIEMPEDPSHGNHI